MKIALTGAAGKLGSTVVTVLRDAGHDVTAIDVAGRREPGNLRVDLTDFGDVIDALYGSRDNGPVAPFDAIVHLAAIPAPNIRSEAATFHNNINATFNVFQAARRLGIKNIVYASSETVLGLPFDVPPPYIPVDEDYPARPESIYSLVKHLEEQMAIQFTRWDPELKIIGLRFSNVMHPEDYAAFPSYDSDAHARKWNLWGYIDSRDGAQAILKALEYDQKGFDRFIVANADTVMSRPSAELAAEVYPDVELKREVTGTETLLSIDKARRLLGYEPQYAWRDQL
jgi:nucleoside-diphosphate-sugar epimerase